MADESNEIKGIFERLINEIIEKRDYSRVHAPGEFEGEIEPASQFYPQTEEYYRSRIQRGPSTGWRSLDEYYSPRKGEWTVVTGIPGHGKTNWLDALIINLIYSEGWKFGIFSAENRPPQRHLVSLLSKLIGSPFWEGPTARMTEFELEKGMEKLDQHISFIDPKEDHMTLPWILDMAAYLADVNHIDGLVIDPYNELDHSRPAGMTETEYISDFISRIRRFASKHSVHVWMVAHPMKLFRDKEGKYPVPTLYDISGSAHWRNKADMGVCVWRDLENDDGLTNIHVQKVRFRENGRLGCVALRFDKPTGRYFDVKHAS